MTPNQKDLIRQVAEEVKVKDLKFEERSVADTDTQYYVDTELGFISVLDRLTGFGSAFYEVRDIETSFRDKDDKDLFWLASGDFDIRRYEDFPLSEAVELIKKMANTCSPGEAVSKKNGNGRSEVL